MATLTPIITGTPGQPPSYNVGMAETFSWVPVGNDAGRPLFARAGYITNLSDMSISLSASNINIGAVEIKDGNSGLTADVEAIAEGFNALRVLTQDLDSKTDDVAIGDRIGNSALVNSALSALCVYSIPYSFTKCETRTSGNPSFIPKQILLHNAGNSNANIILTLTTGLTCNIPVAKDYATAFSLNLSVSGVNAYDGCSITFLA